MKRTILPLTIVAMLSLSMLYINDIRSQVSYADIPCPVCGSQEVLDLGSDIEGMHSQCYDCKADFYIALEE